MKLSELWRQNFETSYAKAEREIAEIRTYIAETAAPMSEIEISYTSHADKHGAIDQTHETPGMDWVDLL